MTLHPAITRAELSDYCQLCHEYRVKSVRVDEKTAGAIKRISFGPLVYLGVKFKVKK